MATGLIKLPIGAITPKGWLRRQLELERDGMIGHLAEISPWCKIEGNAWARSARPRTQRLGRAALLAQGLWRPGLRAQGRGDHPPGPPLDRSACWPARSPTAGSARRETCKTARCGGRRRLLAAHAHAQRPAIVLRIQRRPAGVHLPDGLLPLAIELPRGRFLVGYWAKIRKGDNLESVYWLYNRTGEPWLLELAEEDPPLRRRLDRRHSPTGMASTSAQGFREPGDLLRAEPASGSSSPPPSGITRRSWARTASFPAAASPPTRICRPGYVDPRQGFETCSWVEFMHSFEMLDEDLRRSRSGPTAARKSPSTRCPASMTPDLKGASLPHRAPTWSQLDRRNKAPGIQNGGDDVHLQPLGIPLLPAQRLPRLAVLRRGTLAGHRPTTGLCASLYAASEVTAKVGDGTAVTIAETTDYPFGDTIDLKLATPKARPFPALLPRSALVPASRRFAINGQDVAVAAEPLSYIASSRDWQRRRRASTLQLPMAVGVRTWAKNKNAVSVELRAADASR